MAVYARSDVAAVTLSEAHGGCGETHSRPVVDGAPAKVFKISCNKCEDFLRNDQLWAPMAAQIPETPDETSLREDQEKKSEAQLKQDNAEAFQKIAVAAAGNQELTAKLVELLAQTNLTVPGAQKNAECSNGHSNIPGTKFCAECGVNLSSSNTNTAVKRRTTSTTASAGPVSGSSAKAGTVTTTKPKTESPAHISTGTK